MKAFLLSPLFLVAFAAPSFAYDIGILGGLHFSSPSVELTIPGATDSSESAIGGQLGAAVYFGLVEDFSLRTGGELGYRSADGGNTSVNIHFLSLDIPIYVQYSFTPNVAAFMGPKLSLNLDATCDGVPNCEVRGDDVPSLSVPFAIGGLYKLNEKMGIEAFYEIAMTPIYDVQNVGGTYELWMDTFGANFIYMF